MAAHPASVTGRGDAAAGPAGRVQHLKRHGQGESTDAPHQATQATTPPEIHKPDEQWRQDLTRQQYDVLRRGHTEPAFTGKYVHAKDNGSYCCAGCGNELFRWDAKFESGTGWPSFSQPAVAAAVELRPDKGWFLRRTEVVCRRCGGHLGHVFRDGPAPTRRRYCINSCALAFQPLPSSRDRGDG